MGDGGGEGFGGEVIDYAAADLPVGTDAETVMETAEGGDDDFEDLGFTGGGAAVGPAEHERRPDDEVIDLIWRNAPSGE